VHLLQVIQRLLYMWHQSVEQVPAAVPAVVRTVLPLSQQLHRCSAQLVKAAADAAVRTGTGAGARAGSCSAEKLLQSVMFDVHRALGLLVYVLTTSQHITDAGVAAEALRLQHEPSVAKTQLQVLAAWTAVMHKEHAAHQQQQLQQQQLQQQALPAAAAESSSSSISHAQQQQPRQPAKQPPHADVLPIAAFHQDMLQLVPGGQAYLEAAAGLASSWGPVGEMRSVQIHGAASCCCYIVAHYLRHSLKSVSGQQQLRMDAVVVSAAAVRLVLELQLLAAGAVQRQRQHQVAQQQQQRALTADDKYVTSALLMNSTELLDMLIRALAATVRGCLPPEVLQQARLQLLQALAAPLQQLQLSGPGDSFYDSVASCDKGLASVGEDALYGLLTAACGAEMMDSEDGEADQHS
jgi:hypothetical protein